MRAEASLHNNNFAPHEEGRRAERDATRQTGGAKPMIFAPNKEKAEKSSSAERLPGLEGLVRSEAEHGSAADPVRDGN